jgi:hypothetical protein
VDLDQAAAAHQAALAAVEEIKRANAERLAAARAHVEATRVELAAAVVAEYEAGGRVGELARRARYSRETVRVILRAAGVEPE